MFLPWTCRASKLSHNSSLMIGVLFQQFFALLTEGRPPGQRTSLSHAASSKKKCYYSASSAQVGHVFVCSLLVRSICPCDCWFVCFFSVSVFLFAAVFLCFFVSFVVSLFACLFLCLFASLFLCFCPIFFAFFLALFLGLLFCFCIFLILALFCCFARVCLFYTGRRRLQKNSLCS